ncbi:MAG: hypothetical protein HKN29_10875 [Rhodothermales bacterium]|nr:hypothetical protein [Rhodothermales bacterium]
MKLRFSLLTLMMTLALGPATAFAQTDADHQGVHDAVLDYLEGLYQAAPERIERSVSPDMVKFGWWRQNAESDYRPTPMNFEQLVDLAGSWNTDNRQGIDENTPREIVVLDVLDQTAAAKLTADWGIDYFQLEKIDGKWMIRHVLWQSHPESS